MASMQPNQIVRRYYEDVVNTGNIDQIEQFIAPDYTEVHEGKRYPIGIEGARSHITGGRKTYHDLHLTIDRQITEGDWVVTCVTVTGTHAGEWMGIKPTGKPVVFTCVNVDHVVDGRIVEHGGAANMLGPLLEIGAIKIVGA